MSAWFDIIPVLMILTSFGMLGTSRLIVCIRLAAFQGIVVGLLPLAQSGFDLTARVAAISVIIIALKGFAFPVLLLRALRESNTSREVEPYVGYIASIIVGLLALMVSFWLDSRLALPVVSASDMVVPVAFSMIFTGLFLMVARKNAMNQVLGYLVLENGIYTFGFVMVRDIPILVELGVLMDVFVAVFVMGIAMCRINREFDHMDSDQLNKLRG